MGLWRRDKLATDAPQPHRLSLPASGRPLFRIWLIRQADNHTCLY